MLMLNAEVFHVLGSSSQEAIGSSSQEARRKDGWPLDVFSLLHLLFLYHVSSLLLLNCMPQAALCTWHMLMLNVFHVSCVMCHVTCVNWVE